jgi:diguanylate cyclase (GGDEF)-like protein
MIELASHGGASAAPLALGRPTLLIVADQPRVTLAVHKLFKQDYQVISSRSGQEALLRCQQQQPDLILLAATLPDMSGLDVCKQVLADRVLREIPVLLMRESGDQDEDVQALRLGVQDTVPLPIVPEVTVARVRAHLVGKLQRDMLRGLAYRDGLTGIPNRRRFDLELPRIWSFCARTRSDLAFALVDLDCFRLYNDSYGHAAGDRCLASVAQALAVAARRPHDLVARFGGAEFAVLLPGCKAEAAPSAAQRLADAVAGLAIEHRASRVASHITISCGMAVGVPDERDKPEVLLALADQQLSQAKREGRARTCIAPLGGP